MRIREKKIPFFQILSFVFLMICLGGTIYFFRNHIHTNLDSDEASELVLARLLASEGKLLTKSWYYSSELCYLNMNVVYMLFFKLTDRWYRVRLFGTISVYLLFLISYYRMSSVYKFKEYFLLSAAVFFIPISFEYYSFILKSAWYFPYIIFSILILILSDRFVVTSGRKRVLLAGVAFLFSVILGSNGARELLILFMPLLFASFLLIIEKGRDSESRDWFLFSVVVFCGSVLGYLINSKILVSHYEYQTWDDILFIDFSGVRLERVINSLLNLLGYQTESVFSLSLLPNAVCMVWILLSLYSVIYVFRNRQTVSRMYYRLAVFTVSAFFAFVVFYLFTDTYVRGRYYSPITVFFIPLVSLLFKESDWKKILSRLAFLLIAVITAASGMMFYYKEWDVRPSLEFGRIAKDLVSMEYYNGYATFWNSNVLTELSNGKIDVWSLSDGPEDLKYTPSIDQTYHWLQLVSHDTTHPEGKVFLLLSKDEYDNIWKNELKPEDVILKTNNYTAYGYENYDDLIHHLYPEREQSNDMGTEEG